jgi:hypothetical protein
MDNEPFNHTKFSEVFVSRENRKAGKKGSLFASILISIIVAQHLPSFLIGTSACEVALFSFSEDALNGAC